MRRLLLGTSILALACHHDPPATQPEDAAAAVIPSTAATPSVASTTVVVPPTACLPRTTKHGALSHVEVSGAKVRICYAEAEGPVERDAEPADDACIDVDVTSGSAFAAPRRPSSAAPAVGTPADPIANADGSRAFGFTRELGPAAGASTVYGDTFDGKTKKRLFRVKLSRPGVGPGTFAEPKNSWSAEWLGAGLVIRETLCCDPESASLLLDPERGTTKRLHGFAGAHGAIDETTIFAIDKKKVVFIDVSTQKSIAGPFTAPGAVFPDPELANAGAVLVNGAPNKLIVAYANPPGWVAIDVAAKRASAPVALPLCAGD